MNDDIETQQVDFDELQIGDVIVSTDGRPRGEIIDLHPEFHQVSLDNGATPTLPGPVTILKRRPR